MFPVAPWSVHAYMRGHHIAGAPRHALPPVPHPSPPPPPELISGSLSGARQPSAAATTCAPTCPGQHTGPHTGRDGSHGNELVTSFRSHPAVTSCHSWRLRVSCGKLAH